MLNIFKDVSFCNQGVFGYDIVYTPIEMNLVPNQGVPWRTPWYNYGRNFVCIDVESDKLAKLVVFRDGKYKETIKYDDGKLNAYSDVIIDSDNVIDKNGNRNKDYDYSEYIDFVNINMRCDYGAYLHLVATSESDPDLLGNAKFCVEQECPISLQEYFDWNETPVTDRSALAKAYEKIKNFKVE